MLLAARYCCCIAPTSNPCEGALVSLRQLRFLREFRFQPADIEYLRGAMDPLVDPKACAASACPRLRQLTVACTLRSHVAAVL